MREKIIQDFLSQKDSSWKTKELVNGKYIGQLKKDKRQGIGIMFYNDNSVNLGSWDMNYFKQGTMLAADGTIFSGNYLDNKTLTGSRIATDGTITAGRWVEQKLQGHCSIKFPENNDKKLIRFSGVFKNNLPNGIGMMITEDNLFYGIYENGKQIANVSEIDNSDESIIRRMKVIIHEIFDVDISRISFDENIKNFKARINEFVTFCWSIEGEFGVILNEESMLEKNTFQEIFQSIKDVKEK